MATSHEDDAGEGLLKGKPILAVGQCPPCCQHQLCGTTRLTLLGSRPWRLRPWNSFTQAVGPTSIQKDQLLDISRAYLNLRGWRVIANEKKYMTWNKVYISPGPHGVGYGTKKGSSAMRLRWITDEKCNAEE